MIASILSGISSGNLSGNPSDMSSGTLSGISFCILSGILTDMSSYILPGISSDMLCGTLSGISFGTSGMYSDILSGVACSGPPGALYGLQVGACPD